MSRTKRVPMITDTNQACFAKMTPGGVQEERKAFREEE
jgi:hypothetical protein